MYSGSFLLFNVCINPCSHVINEVPASKRNSQLNHGQLKSIGFVQYRVQHGNQTTVYKFSRSNNVYKKDCWLIREFMNYSSIRNYCIHTYARIYNYIIYNRYFKISNSKVIKSNYFNILFIKSNYFNILFIKNKKNVFNHVLNCKKTPWLAVWVLFSKPSPREFYF